MGRSLRYAMGACVAWGCAGVGSSVHAQGYSREREVKVTGPGGRTIQRRVEIDRGPGFSERQVQIQRPGGTLSRDVRIAGTPAPGFGPGRRPGPQPGFGPGPRPPVFIEHNVFTGPSPGESFALGMLGGAALTAPLWAPPLVSPPPPVVVAPAPAVVVQPPVVVSTPTVVSSPAVISSPAVVSAPAVDPLDGVALAAQRLQSHYPKSRREAAQTLGRLGDPRGVPPLVDALKNDWFKEVRIASALALGAIGGPEAEAVLERAIVYEKKQDVRDAAASALQAARSRRAAVATTAPAATVVESTVGESPRPTMNRASRAPVVIPPPPTPGAHAPIRKPLAVESAPDDDQPALKAPADPIPPPPAPAAPEAGA